ncbi:MAG: hypothetical protein PG981_000219 [Wolbachia endosymbiont of Ctenocephalides orientis wCori]|nr:MAG: hypothetical protein PG981_000219 [Wolbachia endosymbiont of Ctenocephalides orientis wCori]
MSGEEQNESNFNEQLFDAAKSGKLDGVKDAIEKKADINAKDKNGYTPLEGHLEIVKFFINNSDNIKN